MFLTGTFTRTLDEKLRIALPKPLREALAEQLERPLYVAPGMDGSLALYPESSFAQLAGRLGERSPTAREARDYARLFFARATSTKVDRQGRIRIPATLASMANLNGEAVLLGVRDHLELWEKGAWARYCAERSDRYDELAEGAFDSRASDHE